MKLPQHVKNCIDKLGAAGYSAYAVGGAVRDSLLGAEPADWDVTTSARPDEILRVFESERTIPTGIKHGTVTVLLDNSGKNEPIEVTTFRIDGEYRDARHPESVEFSTDVLADLSRRDFTVNAMAFNEREGIIDAFGGLSDLEAGIIRAVGDPKKRFSEDALRILRAFRFSAQLGFEIEEETLRGAIICAPLLKNIARERIGAEIKRLLASKGAVYALKNMVTGNIWSELFEIGAPSIEKIESISRLESDCAFTRAALLIADFDDGQKNAFLDGLRLSNAEKKLVLRLINVKSFDVDGQDLGVVARRFLHLFGDIYKEAFALLRFYNPQKSELFLEIELESAKKRALSISTLAIKGSDLLPLCESNHRRVGILLGELLRCVIECPELNEREKLLEIAEKLIK